jgi:hypothetical protein
MLLPYEQLFIQNYHQEGKLIPEQHRGEPNPLLQLTFDTHMMSHTTHQGRLPYTSYNLATVMWRPTNLDSITGRYISQARTQEVTLKKKPTIASSYGTF